MSDVRVLHGDCVELMRGMPENSVDSIVTDPPYGLEFMGKDWDRPWAVSATNGVGYAGRDDLTLPSHRDSRNANCRACGGRMRGAKRCECAKPEWDRHPRQDMVEFQQWFEYVAEEALRVLKPGGHLLAFGGTRTYHRMACAIEDAGFEIRDSIHWSYSTGFPKSLNVKKAAKDKCCQCEVPWSYGNGHPVPEHDLRQVRRGDVSASVSAGEAGGEVLLAGVSELGVREDGSDGSEPEVGGSEQSGLEGRGDLQASEGKLRRATVRPVSSRVPADGAGRRVHHGASAGDGEVGGANPRPDGSGEPSEPRPARQPAGESRVVPDQRGPQAWRGWAVCERCGKPILPEGLGTALKPAHEPVVVARKPLSGTVAGNVLQWGTGGLNIDGCRVKGAPRTTHADGNRVTSLSTSGHLKDKHPHGPEPAPSGRWPANVVFDRTAGEALDQQSGERPAGTFPSERGQSVATKFASGRQPGDQPAHRLTDKGGASRFFTQADFGPDDWPFVYQAKPSRKERNAGLDGLPEQRREGTTPQAPGRQMHGATDRFPAANHHPTVKPVALMRHLVRLVTPPGGTVLDPFAGSGTTLVAAMLEGFDAVGCEMTDEYLPIIEGRVAWAQAEAEAGADNPEQPTLL